MHLSNLHVHIFYWKCDNDTMHFIIFWITKGFDSETTNFDTVDHDLCCLCNIGFMCIYDFCEWKLKWHKLTKTYTFRFYQRDVKFNYHNLDMFILESNTKQIDSKVRNKNSSQLSFQYKQFRIIICLMGCYYARNLIVHGTICWQLFNLKN